MAVEMTDANLQAIREEIGSTPSDNTVEDTWSNVGGGVARTALAILRPRLADALTAAAQGGTTIPGAIGITAPAQPTLLAAQISRLEGQLAAETGAVDDTGLAATSVLVGRTDRPR